MVAELVDRFLAGEYTVLEQDTLGAGHGTVTVRNTQRAAYRDKSGKVWYFSGATSSVKKKAGPAIAVTFQAEEPKGRSQPTSD